MLVRLVPVSSFLYFRATEKNTENARNLEEEMEQQITMLEKKIREEVRPFNCVLFLLCLVSFLLLREESHRQKRTDSGVEKLTE